MKKYIYRVIKIQLFCEKLRLYVGHGLKDINSKYLRIFTELQKRVLVKI